MTINGGLCDVSKTGQAICGRGQYAYLLLMSINDRLLHWSQGLCFNTTVKNNCSIPYRTWDQKVSDCASVHMHLILAFIRLHRQNDSSHLCFWVGMGSRKWSIPWETLSSSISTCLVVGSKLTIFPSWNVEQCGYKLSSPTASHAHRLLWSGLTTDAGFLYNFNFMFWLQILVDT